MIQREEMPRRFGTHASVIQLVALFVLNSTGDGGATLHAGALASLLFWACSISLLLWHRGRVSILDLLFLRWGLLAFVLIGTPWLRPVIEWWGWLPLMLLPSVALLFVASLLYLFTRIFGLSSPFDDMPT